MSLHDALIQAIRDAPDDDAPRLIYADYLEEHGDPDRAEFIRLQCELARRPRDEDDSVWQQLESRQRALLKAREDAWLGDVVDIRKDPIIFNFHFRRGFVEECALDAPIFQAHAATLARCMPLWLDATFSRGRGMVRQLVDLPELARLRRLTFASRLDIDDARALADWPGLAGVQSLRFWGCDRREHDHEVCNILAGSPHVRGLQLLEMIQVRGGLGSNYPDEDGAAWARRLEKRINARLDCPIFRASRPFEKTFPVKSCESYGFYAGTLPRKRQALIGRVRAEYVNVAVFDRKGTFLQEFNGPLPIALQRPPEEYYDVNDEELYEFLLREFGFRPGRIHIKEFVTGEGLSVHLLPWHYQEDVEDPDSTDEEGSAVDIQGWIDRGDFVLDWGNDYFMDADGEVTSS
jgi:uncharacterized protein (TIGR02996 family)